MALSAAIEGASEAIVPIALAAVAGSAAYLALFVVIGTTFRRAAWWSLAFVLLGERLLGGVLTGIAQLSLSTMVYAGLGPNADSLERAGMPTGGAAVGRLALLTVVFVLLAVRRIRRFRITSGGE